MSALLEVEGLHAGYGTLSVLFDVDLAIKAGEAAALASRSSPKAGGSSPISACVRTF